MPFFPFRKIIALFFFFTWWIFLVSPAGAEIEVLFSPEGVIKGHVLKEVESTTSTVDLAVHEITSSEMAQAFLKARERRVKVRIIADSRQSKMRPSKISYLIHQGISVKVLGGKKKGLMNHRFAILDGKKVITGSWDWSGIMESSSYEHLLVLTDTDVVASFQKEFGQLWREKRVVK